ncbi:MAG: winged helix-turn-helix domain-containing protein, partial [Candidatus Limnocylindria bacterium]
MRQLTMLQIDPTAAIAPSADLVAWSRLGSAYQPAQLQQALEQDHALFEHNAMIRPMEDLGLHLAEMATFPSYDKQRHWLKANDRFRRDVVDRLRASGPLLSRDIPDTSQVPWPSSGWTNDRNVTQMLEFLMARAEVAIAGRVGRQRVWDVPERVYPASTVVVPLEEARRIRDERRLRSLGVARERGTAVPLEPNIVGSAGELATIDGVAGKWRVDPEALGKP